MSIFDTTLEGMQLYFTDWKVERKPAGLHKETVRIFDKTNATPLVHISFQTTESKKKERVATLQLMHYRNNDDMMAFGSLAASLFGAGLANILVVQFEESFATSKLKVYEVSEAFLPADKGKSCRTPYHFSAAFERAILKHTDSLIAFSPRVMQPLSDGDYYYAIYTIEEHKAKELTDLFTAAYKADGMHLIPKRMSDIAGKEFARKTEFDAYKGNPCFIWESGANAIVLDMETKHVDVRMKHKPKGGSQLWGM